MEKLTSALFSLNTREWFKGLKITVVAALVVYFQNSVFKDGFTIDALVASFQNWKPIVETAITAGTGYLGVTFFSGTKKLKK